MMETTHFQVSNIQSSEGKPAQIVKVEPFHIPQQQQQRQQQQQQQTCYSTWACPPPFLPPVKRYTHSYEHHLSIDNPHGSLSTLIDIVYPRLQCSLCDHVSFTSIEARKHHHERHSSIPQFSCLHPHCELVFKTRSALFYHVQQSHLVISTNTDNIYTQQECISPIATTPVDISSSSSSSPKLDTSSRKSDGYSPSWRVSSFPRISTNRAPRGSKKITLSPHIDSRLNAIYPPLQCPSCHQKFNRKTNVIKHLTDQHHGEEPYRCVIPGCTHPKYYATREGLVYHTLRAHDSNSSTKTTFTASTT